MTQYLYILSRQQYKSSFFISIFIILYHALAPASPSTLIYSFSDSMFQYPDKSLHILSFLFLAFLLNRASSDYTKYKRNILSLLVFGILIEVLQSFTGYREMSLTDVLADTIGILLYQAIYTTAKTIQLLKRSIRT